jgi:methionyl-tRNA formyltransferase
MYGKHVHEAVIAARETESGITIHYVNERCDEGVHLLQACCPVLPDDTPENLAERIHALEHEHYPGVVEEVLRRKRSTWVMLMSMSPGTKPRTHDRPVMSPNALVIPCRSIRLHCLWDLRPSSVGRH